MKETGVKQQVFNSETLGHTETVTDSLSSYSPVVIEALSILYCSYN